MDVIIYGLGFGAEFVESRLSKENRVIGYTDSYANITIFFGKHFIKLDELKKIQFDYIIITIQNRETAYKIYDMLVDRYNIPKEKVIPYFVYAESENYKIKFGYLEDKKIEGLIFGNSVAKYGIQTDYLTSPFLNLAVPRQDIYFDYRTFLLCRDMYAQKLHNLRYVIIDLYDYQIFNLDLSLCENFMAYVAEGGYWKSAIIWQIKITIIRFLLRRMYLICITCW